MRRNGAVLEVVVGRRVCIEYPYEGRVYVEGRRGSEYALRIRNHSGRRALFILTVDGLSVMDGQPGSMDSSGYILEPGQMSDIPGWRLDNHDVAHFQFSTLPEAYASQKGAPENVGVIGCAVFYEKPQSRLYYHEIRPEYLGDPCTPGSGKVATFGRSIGSSSPLGTGFGRKTEHSVRSEAFDREPSPSCVMELNYDSFEGLRGKGVNLTSHVAVGSVTPSAFPTETGCTPPPGWRG